VSGRQQPQRLSSSALQTALLPGYALKVRQSMGAAATPEDVACMQVRPLACSQLLELLA
jgi:hypothetical protein